MFQVRDLSVCVSYLFSRRRHARLDYDNGPSDVFFLHPLAVHLNGLDAHFHLLWWTQNTQISTHETFSVTRTPASHLTWKEHKHLVGGVVIVGHQHGEVRPSGSTLAGSVSKLTFKLVQGLVQLVLGHQISSIVAELQQHKTTFM